MVFENTGYKLRRSLLGLSELYKWQRSRLGLQELPKSLKELQIYFPGYDYKSDVDFPFGLIREISQTYDAFSASLLSYFQPSEDDLYVLKDIQILEDFKTKTKDDLRAKLTEYIPTLKSRSHQFASLMADSRTIGMTQEVCDAAKDALNETVKWHILEYLPFVSDFQNILHKGWTQVKRFPELKTAPILG